MANESVGDAAYGDFTANLHVLQAARADGRIAEDEQPAVIAAIDGLSDVEPIFLVITVSMRAIGHLSRVGVLAFPQPRMRREIAELRAVVMGSCPKPLNMIDIAAYLAHKNAPVGPEAS